MRAGLTLRAVIAALACAAALAVATDAQASQRPGGPPMVGGQRDAYGCLAPAGYRWCAREKACVRPWELARKRGFPNTPQGFARHCLDRF